MRLCLIFSFFVSSVFLAISLTIRNDNDLILPDSDRQLVATNDKCLSVDELVNGIGIRSLWPCNPSPSTDFSPNDQNSASLGDLNLDMINPENSHSAFAGQDNDLFVNDGNTDLMTPSLDTVADALGGVPWSQAPRSLVLIVTGLLGLVYDSVKNLFFWPKKTSKPGENRTPAPQPSPENAAPPPPKLNLHENLCPYSVVGPRTHAVCDAGDVDTILLLLDTSDVYTLTINLISTTPCT